MTFSSALDLIIERGYQVRRTSSPEGVSIGLDYGGVINVYVNMTFEAPWIPTKADVLADDWQVVT